MANRKSACCDVSALEVTLGILFILMTGVCVTLVTLMATWKTQTGEDTHTHTGEADLLCLFAEL